MPTASSITALPQALQLIQGARTKDNLCARSRRSIRASLTSIPKAQCAEPDRHVLHLRHRLNLLNLRNPVTGDFVIPAPRAGATLIGNDITGPVRSVGGNPFIRQRNVVPAEFTQDQLHGELDGQSSRTTA